MSRREKKIEAGEEISAKMRAELQPLLVILVEDKRDQTVEVLRESLRLLLGEESLQELDYD